MNDFRKQNDLDGSQGDLRALGHPQRLRQAQPGGVLQVVMFSKNFQRPQQVIDILTNINFLSILHVQF